VTVDADGLISVGSELPGSDKTGLRAVLPLAVHNKWVVLHDPHGPAGVAEVLLLVAGSTDVAAARTHLRERRSPGGELLNGCGCGPCRPGSYRRTATRVRKDPRSGRAAHRRAARSRPFSVGAPAAVPYGGGRGPVVGRTGSVSARRPRRRPSGSRIRTRTPAAPIGYRPAAPAAAIAPMDHWSRSTANHHPAGPRRPRHPSDLAASDTANARHLSGPTRSGTEGTP